MNDSKSRKLTSNSQFFTAALLQARVYAWQPSISVEHGTVEIITSDYVALKNEDGYRTCYSRSTTVFIQK